MSPVVKELKAQVALAAPLAAASAGQQLFSVVDTAVVGRLGATEIGAVGLGHALFGFFLVLGMGVMLGLDPLLSQAIGAGERARARGLMWQAVWLSIVVGGVVTVGLALSPFLLPFFGVQEETTALTATYLWSRAPGLLPTLTFIGVRSYLQALDVTRPMVLGMTLANLVNAPLAWLLVHGEGAIPSLGVVGAGLATTVSVFLQLYVLARFIQGISVENLPHGVRRPNAKDMLQAWKVGAPLCLQMGAEVGVFSLVGVLAGRLGENELAGHQVAITVASMSFMVALGVGTAGSVRVGRAVGARDRVGVRLAGLVAFGSSGSFMALSALSLWAFPRFFAELLTDQPDVIAISMRLLIVAAVFQLSDGIQAVGAGVLRGAGDTQFLSHINLAAHYLVGLPIAGLLGFGLGMGIMGLWWGLCIGLSVVAVGLFTRFVLISRREITPLAASPPAH